MGCRTMAYRSKVKVSAHVQTPISFPFSWLSPIAFTSLKRTGGTFHSVSNLMGNLPGMYMGYTCISLDFAPQAWTPRKPERQTASSKQLGLKLHFLLSTQKLVAIGWTVLKTNNGGNLFVLFLFMFFTRFARLTTVGLLYWSVSRLLRLRRTDWWRGEVPRSTWLGEGWFPSTFLCLEQSWASKLAAKACMAAGMAEQSASSGDDGCC